MFPDNIDLDTQSGIPHYLISSYYNYVPEAGSGLSNIIDYKCEADEDFYLNFNTRTESPNENADEWLFTYMNSGTQTIVD